jgi:Reverse transcriptase (RNA-dependent DNA polymerase)
MSGHSSGWQGRSPSSGTRSDRRPASADPTPDPQQRNSADPNDPGYRRLHYSRYADDWLLGFTGPRQEAEQIKARVGEFLRDQLKLELSPAKTLVTHGRTRPVRYLGYQIVVLHADHKHDQRGHRSINAGIGLKVPADVIRAKCAPYLHHGKPIRRTERTVDTDYSIVAQFQAEFRVSRSTTGWRSTVTGSAS